MSPLDLQERLTKPAAPAKSWRNWYRVHERLRVSRRVGVWERGVTPGPDLFPSTPNRDPHSPKRPLRDGNRSR